MAARPVLDLAVRLRRRLLALVGWPTRGVKAMVSDPDGRLLLVRHSYGRSDLWMLPGGGMGWRERPEAAIRREIAEEVGCALDWLELSALYVARGEGRRDTVHLFRATSADVPRIDGVELVEARFFPLDELPADLSPATRRRIAEERGERIRDGRW